MTEIILQKNVLANGKVRFDLIGKNLPQNFLGLATDMDFQQKFADGDYQGMTLSPELQLLANQGQLIDLAKPILEEGKLVVGLTLKANHLVRLPDGVLASFTFNSALDAQGFSNQVLSIYESGRKDIQTDWLVNNQLTEVGPENPVQIEKTADSTEQILSKTANSSTDLSAAVVADLPVDDLDGLVQTDLNETALQQLLHQPVQVESNWLAENWLIALLLAVSAIAVLATLLAQKKFRLKPRIRPAVSPLQKTDFA